MICPECGHETTGNFCSNCGAHLKTGRAPAARRNTYEQNPDGRRVKAWVPDSDGTDVKSAVNRRNEGRGDNWEENLEDNRKIVWEEDGYGTGLYEPSPVRSRNTGKSGRNSIAQGQDRPESREERRESLRKKEKPGKTSGRGSGNKSSSAGNSGKSGPGKKEVRLEQKEKRLRDSRMRDLESEVERLTVQQRLRDRRSREDEDDAQTQNGSGPDLGEMAAKGAAGAVVITARVMQLVSCLLMGSMVLVMLRSFFSHGEELGNINTMAAERNYGLALYVGIAGAALFMGVIWCLWILSRKGAGGGFRLKKYDTGRGLIPFLLCAFAVMAAGPLLTVIPPVTGVIEEWQGIVAGGRAALTAVMAQRGTLMFCSGAGAVLSLIRRILLV